MRFAALFRSTRCVSLFTLTRVMGADFVVSGHQVYVNYRHLALLVDCMTFRGYAGM